MNAKPTPGPWFRLPENNLCIESQSGNVAICNLARQSDADARRIVECVNALEGLDPTAIKALVETVQKHILEMDKLMTPEIWRTIPPLERGQRIAALIKTLEQALAAMKNEKTDG